ncbi:MAG TPA: FkbM family methyltransferase [Gemmatimonadaceae bacterium]|nr:FkbM family methyltransferase [Gemmatimonadaceae bacterium]
MFRKLGAIARVFREPHYRHNPRWVLSRLRRLLAPAQPGLKTVKLPWGVELRVDPDEFIGASIWATGVHDLAVSEAIYRLLDDGDTAVDVGANIGYTTSIMAVRAGRRGRVMAFEPHPMVFDQLAENAALLARSEAACRPELYKTALSDRTGQGMLVTDQGWTANRGLARIDDASNSAGIEATSVEIKRLDEVIGDQSISLLKLDVEGHEAEVLRGASRLLERGLIRTVIYEETAGDSGVTHQILSDAGFTLMVLDSTRAGPLVTLWGPHRIRPAPDWLATLDKEEVERRFSRKGWRLFSRATGRN